MPPLDTEIRVDFSYLRDRENLRKRARTLSERHARLRGVPGDVPLLARKKRRTEDARGL